MAWIFTNEVWTNDYGSISNYNSLFSKSLSWWYSTWTHRRFDPTHILVFSSLSVSSYFSAELLLVLRKFGKCNIKWPKNDGVNHNMPGLITCFFDYMITYVCRFLSCCISRITFSVWTSQTLYSTTTFNYWLFSSHSYVTNINNNSTK